MLKAREIIEKRLQKEISFLIEDSTKPKLLINFKLGYSLFIRYNDFNEYSYQFSYSKKLLHRFRFDNYDDKWNVFSKPHHLHERNSEIGIESPMNGQPDHDMAYLIDYIRKNVILWKTKVNFTNFRLNMVHKGHIRPLISFYHRHTFLFSHHN